MGRLSPEQLARQQIDLMLVQCGWVVQDYAEMDISAGLGVAVREFPLKSGFADYLLYGSGKVLGVIEAKPEGHTLRGVETQSAKYLEGLPPGVPRWTPDGAPLAFAYESTGTVTQFTSKIDPDPRNREVFAFHRPEELLRLATLDKQLRANLRQAIGSFRAGSCTVSHFATRHAFRSQRYPRIFDRDKGALTHGESQPREENRRHRGDEGVSIA